MALIDERLCWSYEAIFSGCNERGNACPSNRFSNTFQQSISRNLSQLKGEMGDHGMLKLKSSFNVTVRI